MKRSTRILLISLLTLTSIGILSLRASALTYQNSVDVQFTFNSILSVSLSSSDISIDNLMPGSATTSEPVSVSVNTNGSSGYYLAATVGTSNSNNSRLTHTENSSYYFTSLATNANLASMDNASINTWGFAYSTDGTNWSTFRGLPTDAGDDGATGAKLIDTNNPHDSQSIDFIIGAKAGVGQAAGEYTNTINFYAVANTTP